MFEMLGRLVALIVTIPSEMLGVLCDLAEKLASDRGSEWFKELARFCRREPCWVAVTETAGKVKKYLRCLFEAEIGAVDGTETFAGSGVFPGGVYGVTLPVTTPRPTPLTPAAVYEQIVDGTFDQVYGSLGEKRRRWTEAQVVEFCRKNRGKLRTEGYGTFFELEGGFVAGVFIDDVDRLEVGVGPFSDDVVWDARYRRRFVAPL
ncbi:hypothetical protein A2647_01140 [Candidatus Nomurabacteria bacterium RIFCSPHIGHO2_01_FULL_40_24b]|uniref:Uncharacterized protein n=1 Tax=Candidatus Nomurabacteria bacterium RIFCSPHIGHO2_01_FULL_40_24b TaxID=1801739 RepID=A0A1F6V729_9BACT|nr:MAG: hypothetical protein A2647_01140 [Candidatus Nomurabacteria bacterium RIFCSPHIGHO2_01_FULL_40_24b]